MWFGLCAFTGKELDSETGYGYFGARYMDHELMTMWLSVDPMSDKYPGVSPYAYCNWNPVKLVDPDGREWDPASLRIVEAYRKQLNGKLENAQTEYERKEIQAAIDELSVLNKSNQMYHIEYGEVSGYYKKGETDYDLKNNWVSMTIAYDGDIYDMAHEMKHAYQFEVGELSFDSHTGGCATAVLYDITDQESAYRRGSALGGKIPKNLEWDEKFPFTNKSTGEKGYFYPFLHDEDVKSPNIAGGRDFPACSREIHGSRTSVNNIYRYGGKTYKN